MGVGVFVPDTAITPQCRICFSDKLKFLRVPPAELKSGAPASSSGSSDDSTVTSASMESDDAPGVAHVSNGEFVVSSEDDMPLQGSCVLPLGLYPSRCLKVLGDVKTFGSFQMASRRVRLTRSDGQRAEKKAREPLSNRREEWLARITPPPPC